MGPAIRQRILERSRLHALDDAVSSGAGSLRDAAYEWGAKTVDYVKEHPARSALIAAGVALTVLALKGRAAELFTGEAAEGESLANALKASPLERIAFPARSELLTSPVEQLHQQFALNQAALEDLVAANRERIPLMGFHGASAPKFEYLLNAAKTEEGAGLQTATFWQKSSEPKVLLADLGKAAHYADGYTLSDRVEYLDQSLGQVHRGSIAVLDLSRFRSPFDPDQLISSDKIFGSGGQFYWSQPENFAHRFVRLTPKNAAQIYRGAIGPEITEPFELPRSASVDRKLVAQAMGVQKIVLEGLKLVGVTSP